MALASLVRELTALTKLGVDVSRVSVSDRAHLVLPYHAALDRAAERARGNAALGTTGRGIGPAYIDRVARSGITFAELRRPDVLAEKIRAALQSKAAQLAGDPDLPPADELVAQTLELAATVRPHVVDGVAYVHEALERGETILAEGAQGSMLDINYGTYPFVTSSVTIAAGACVGLGVGPRAVGTVSGIAKAYCTRVGGGPFPSELDNPTGERLREIGREFGVVTGRPRRCGWFDVVAGRYAVRVNGLDNMIITKLDVLSGFEKVGLVTGYRHADGSPAGIEAIGEPGLRVDVEEFPGWSEDLRDIKHIKNLPRNAQAYLTRLANEIGVPITLVSVGPERSAFAT